MGTYVFLFGALIGLVAGLAICYWQKIKTAVQNKDKISAASNLYDAIVGVKNQF